MLQRQQYTPKSMGLGFSKDKIELKILKISHVKYFGVLKL